MLMTGFAFSRLKLNKIYANVLKFNQRSISLLIKLGFKKDAELRANIRYGDKFVDELIYSILSSEYQEKARIDVEE
jgi:ribosomal-protein-alanine N-acetyltransferase